jgi:uncharacterized protein YbjT (DUF2867 family)
MEIEMYAITGITGNVGGALARELLARGEPVRAVVRDRQRAQSWAAQGCEIAVARMEDSESLTAAFRGAKGVFVLPPPEFDPAPGFPEARVVTEAVSTALRAALPEHVVCLSTIGAQARESNLLTQRTLMEEALRNLPMAVTFLRPAWFFENAAWDVASAREQGLIESYLQPLDKPLPMVATADVGRLAAALLLEPHNGTGPRVIELEGPRRVSPNDIAAAFARVLGRPVHAQVVERNRWEALFVAQGMKHPLPRMRMLDGFNEGWISFEHRDSEIVRGDVELETVIQALVTNAR